jgi:hypothetical protein
VCFIAARDQNVDELCCFSNLPTSYVSLVQVYLGILPSQKCVAVKRLHADAVNVEKQFHNEIEALSRYVNRSSG